MSEFDGDLPWGLSDLKPCGLVTNKDRDPQQVAQAHEDAIRWAQLGIATRNRCQTHGLDYTEHDCFQMDSELMGVGR